MTCPQSIPVHLRLLAAAGIVALFANPAEVQAIDPPAGLPALKTADRFRPEHLEKATADARTIQATRKDRPLPAGWQDVRSIFHAHAEDSEHTGGTRPEMIADAKKAGVRAIFLSDHLRPPRDFVSPERRGEKDGVLLIPGSEAKGFLIHPVRSIMDKLDLPRDEFLDVIRADGGLAFLSHIEERTDHPMDKLDGLEITNRHYEARADIAGYKAMLMAMTSADSIAEMRKKLENWPDATFAFQGDYPKVYLSKWDDGLKTRRLVGVAANDCHHNNVLTAKLAADGQAVLVGTNVDKDDDMFRIPLDKAKGLNDLVTGRKPGEVIATVDLDPYRRSFANASTHLIVQSDKVDETVLRDTIRKGRMYVSHDWICPPEGFFVTVTDATGQAIGTLGDEISFVPKKLPVLKVALPAQASLVRLIRDGAEAARQENTAEASFLIEEPGVYRVEVFQKLDGEYRGWIYASPVYVK
ncbi:histidinol phosphatase [bacterium]|nr:histidinol phosphatase [bacterium]